MLTETVLFFCFSSDSDNPLGQNPSSEEYAGIFVVLAAAVIWSQSMLAVLLSYAESMIT